MSTQNVRATPAGSYRAKYQSNVTNSDVKGNVDVDISVSPNGSKAVIPIMGYGLFSPNANLTVALLGRTSLATSR